ncbi:ATP-dependent DNA helicase RecG [Fusobacterium sp. DD29]|uniref:ATP-dependent DNA helicase RecG n=1 Tax=unclassified Fusobacterium TaxID=2648384 RepID=UPI001B8DA38E|nr:MULTISPECIES: ATP-dependent DNA helicase RecG [unclassified Fusobacterium]MBR8700564.1 ATP-dependent DNA helicase RecG [Fusobacterium sp. DD45]MBR8710313.1 ATP-dependent DNA helicase RecG [Fusobacterium sp. DD28]MBR8749289.1 ATP-dependent DNA helicase RecG [Fusobacterium sp. DD29]MBR8750801.1 ATP-dependent DNA helicase RecG [Fusobacterium sp. DD26]MBR8761555.1 ATP-dependent DNA helicase RecG [Fusobacterium sp. DD25]
MDNYNLTYLNLKEFTKDLNEKDIKKLHTLGINTLHDLFYYFPRAYDDRTNIMKIGDLRGEEYVVLKANLLNVTAPPTKSGVKMVKATATDGSGMLDIVWFQMPYLRKTLKPGEEYIFIGQVKRGYRFQMVNPEFKLSSSQRKLAEGEILPIYSTSKTLPQNSFRKVMKILIKKYIPLFYENIPNEILKQFGIMGRREALIQIHFPTNNKNLEETKRRFAIEELLVLELGIIQKKFETIYDSDGRYSLPDNKALVTKYLNSLSFELTGAQKRVITEIYKDLNKGKIVNRLIQGDVGSGKTVVSIVLLLYMLANSYQGALMAPTEILAEQHYLSVKDKFEELGIRVELLTGSFTGKKKQKIIEDIKNGDVGIVIGTHALIEENVVFKKLGMIIIDEQHRFGVVQRKKLRDKGVLANLIVMSATPIPRSLALSIYGDLDVSIIDELPPGRKPIRTKWISSTSDLKIMYDFIDKKLSQGRQAYFVAPLIEESEKLSAKSVEELKSEVEKYLPKYRIGVLHGRLKNSEKNEVMQDFKNRKYDILVATTVIEVGVDVPNSSIMVISDAQRFGLSALHQLRGRVGRGKHQSYCFLLSKTDNDTSKARLQVMEETEDGFKIAEEDLRLRKPGEIFGTKQSGLSDLKFIDIIHDVKTIKLAKDIATNYLKKNKGQILNEYMTIDIAEKFKES